MSHESPMMRHQEGDGVVMVQFKWGAVKNDRATSEQGRPIFDKVLRVYITTPGSKNQEATHEIERHFWVPEGEEPHIRENQVLKHRFRAQLEAWKSDSAEELAGTPLTELTSLDAAQVATCKASGLHTIEALAGLSDGNLFMGAQKWRALAKSYMEKAEGGAPISKLTAENEDLRQQIAALAEQVEQLTAPDIKKGGKQPAKAA